VNVFEQAIDSGEWVAHHADYLYRYAWFHVHNREAAEDLVQETLLFAFQNRQAYQGRSSERTWLVAILKQKLVDYYRRPGRSREMQQDFEPDDDFAANEAFQDSGIWAGHWREDRAPSEWHVDPMALVREREFWETLSRCLAALPPRIAAAFTLREIEGLSSEEICRVLEVSPNNLWVMLHRARAQLREAIEKEWLGHQPSTRGSGQAIQENDQKPATALLSRVISVSTRFSAFFSKTPREA
jgi:RNA polymerase sigma-70 factor (TIGR02943 family)